MSEIKTDQETKKEELPVTTEPKEGAETTQTVVEGSKVVEPLKEEPKVEEPKPEENKETIPAEPPKVEVKTEPIIPAKVTLTPEMDVTLSKRDRILAFLGNRRTGNYIRVNDFLKSLYAVPKPNMPAQYTDQREMKFLRNLFRDLQRENKVEFASNSYERLGTHYYETGNTVTKYHNITTVIIEAKAI